MEQWPTPDEGALDEQVRATYFARKKAVKLYFYGATEKIIKEAAGIGLKQVYRLIRERCLQTHVDGLFYGWRGLIPNQRINPYQRKKKIRVDKFGYGASGALTVILEQYPDIKRRLDKKILSSSPDAALGEVRRSHQSHWKWFLEELRKLGCEVRGEWPFNTESNGYSSICRYINRVLAANPREGAKAEGGPDLVRKLASGDGVNRPVDRVFQRVEMDAHKLDGRFCVMLPHATGGWIPKIIHRLWVVVILEIVSRAVLGYHLSFGREVSKEDILRTIKNALTRWTRKLLAFSDVPYCADANLPSGASEIFVGVCWDETSVDGALAQTCTHVRGVLQDIVNASLIEPSVGFSKRRSKDDRPFIETFFRTLGSRGFQRLTNTTGGDPKGKQGRNPENIAITSQFQLEYAQELLDVLIANYNATPHTNLGYRSPLAYLEFCAKSTDTNFRHADPNSVQQVLSFRKRCVVKGGYKKGRQPYINFESARYTSEFLSQRHDLVGSYIWITNHIEDDARMVQASTLDGLSLGILRAAPPWHRLPHSLKLRRAITSCVRRRMFVLVNGADGVESFIKFIEAQTNRKLPIHPAYLEARRILIQEAEQTTGESMLAVAKARALDSPPEPKQDKTGDEKRQNKPSSAKPPLPPMRQAATD